MAPPSNCAGSRQRPAQPRRPRSRDPAGRRRARPRLGGDPRRGRPGRHPRPHARASSSGWKRCSTAPAGPGLLFDTDRAQARTIARSGLAQASAASPLWIIGDLHGDLLALEAALALIRPRRGAGRRAPRIVFLGDLFDDEGFGLEVLLRVFELILDAPERVCVIAGNHDEALSFDGDAVRLERVARPTSPIS